MSEPKYTITVYAAAPGTPLYKNGAPKLDGKGDPETSVPGHMYYVTSNGIERNSWGFAPVEHGSVNGPGGVSTTDFESYHNPFYARTMEISKEQYDKLNYLPAHNDESLKTIRDPVPGSPLNKEDRHPMPDMGWWQRGFLTENEQGQPGGPDTPHRPPIQVAGAATMPAAASNDDPFEQLVRASVSGDTEAFSATARGYMVSADGQPLMVAGREANRQQDAQRQQEYAALQQSQPAAPPMSMRF